MIFNIYDWNYHHGDPYDFDYNDKFIQIYGHQIYPNFDKTTWSGLK